MQFRKFQEHTMETLVVESVYSVDWVDWTAQKEHF